MKRIFLILLLFGAVMTSHAQLTRYYTQPSELGLFKGPVSFIAPAYFWATDTSFHPAYVGGLVFRTADSSFYASISVAGPRYWQKIGTGSGGTATAWGNIPGNINSQTDLFNKFNSKQDTLPFGTSGEYWTSDRNKHNFQSDVFSAIGNATFDLPLTYSTGHFGINQASQSQAGFVGSSDFTKFLQAYNGKIVSVVITGTTTKTLTITSQDGTTYTASFTDLTGTSGTGITQLNGDNSAVQSFATGTNGTDFNIGTSGGVHTFNIPTIGAGVSRGLLSFADWQKLNAGGDTTNTVATHSWVIALANKIRPIYLDYGLSYINDSTMKVDTSVIAYKAWAVPQSRKLTINGTTFDLSQDRTWSISTSSGLTFQQSLVNVANVVNLLNDSASLVNNRAYASISGNRGWKSMQLIDTTGWANGKFPYVSGTQFALKNLVISDVNSLQSSLDAKENLSNKATSLASPDNTHYPTTQAVSNAIASFSPNSFIKSLSKDGSNNVSLVNDLLTGRRQVYGFDTAGNRNYQNAQYLDSTGIHHQDLVRWDTTSKMFKPFTPNYVTTTKESSDSSLLRGLINTNTTNIATNTSNIALKVNLSDTAAMLSPYLRKINVKGGTTGQSLVKNSNTDYDFTWTTPAAGGVTSFNTRTGPVVPAANDYSFSQLSGDLVLPNHTIDPTGSNGLLHYNTTTNKVRAYINGAYESLATESYTNGQFRTGNYIYVDVNNPSSTDTRGTLSKYSLTVPFHTVQAAINSYASGDVIYVRAGTYNETDSITTTKLPSLSDNNIYLILDNATINGGTAPAIYTSINKAITITLNGGTLNNTGNASDTHNAAALYVNTSTLIINGTGGTITSTQSNGVYIAGMTFRPNWSNASITSTNSYAVYNSTAAFPQFTNCAMASTTAGALFGVTQMSLNTCTVQSRFACIDLSNQAPSFSIQNSQLTSDSSYVITNTGLGSSGGTNVGNIYSSKLTGYSGIVSFSVGNASFVYTFNFDNCKEITNNGAATAAFSLPSASGSTTQVKTTNTISNIPLYTSAYRTSAEGIKAIVESNTNISNVSAFYNVFVGIGATSQVGSEKLRVGGNLIIDALKTGNAAPTTSGTVKMVVTDANGLQSFQDIPSGGSSGLSGTGYVKQNGAATSYVASIPNSDLANSSITIAGNSTALGGSVTQDNITGLSSTGIVKRTAANTLAIATAGTDYVVPASNDLQHVTTVGATSTNEIILSASAAAPGTITDYLALKPSDYSSGKPGLFFSKTTTANSYQATIWDGTVNTGTLNFSMTGLTLNGDQLATVTSPGLLGTPTAPTATAGTNTSQIATTAFVHTEIVNAGSGTTYTPGAPIATHNSNIASAQYFDAQYSRSGNTVTVSGEVSYTATTASTITYLNVVLPVSSTLSQEYQLAGTAATDPSWTSSGITESGAVKADTAHNEARIVLYPASTASRHVFFTFTYSVN